MTNEITIGNKTYELDDDGRLIGVEACCFSEEHFSHPYCSSYPSEFNAAEEAGVVDRHYNGTGWYWYAKGGHQ